MIDIWMLFISTIAGLAAIYASINLERLYRTYNNFNFRILALGIYLYGFIAYSYIILGLGTDIWFANLATTVHRILAVIGFGIGFSCILLGFLKLIEIDIPNRYYIYFILNLLVIPYIFATGFEFSWDGQRWISIYTPEIFRYLVVSPAFYVGIEISLTTYQLVKDSPLTKLKWIHWAMSISFISTVPVFLLREALSLPFNLFLLPMIFYLVFLSLLLRTEPELFLTTMIEPHFLLILDSEIARPIKMFHFVANDYLDSDENLLSGAIIAIQSVLQEMSNSDQKLSYIGFPNTHIIIEEAEGWNFILGSIRPSDALMSLLKEMKEEFMKLGLESGDAVIDESAQDKITALVSITFFHQLKRLNLMLELIDTN